MHAGSATTPSISHFDYGSCAGTDIPVPVVGAHSVVTGPYVIDHEHGWAEIHPVWQISGATGPTTAARATASPSVTSSTTNCAPSYPDFCLPPPPDLDCQDVAPHKNFTVLPPDPHHFDANHNGKGCET